MMDGGWQVWLIFGLILYPGLVMIAWSVWVSIRARSPVAFLKLFFASVMLTPLVVLGWILGAGIALIVFYLILTIFNPTPGLFQGLVYGFLALVIVVGTPIGWRYLDSEMPADVRDFKL